MTTTATFLDKNECNCDKIRLMLGLKISAPSMLFGLIKYKRKQQRKIDKLKAVLQVRCVSCAFLFHFLLVFFFLMVLRVVVPFLDP